MKTVIEMAKKAGFTEGELAFMGDNFIRFAELVRADEAEQPAQQEHVARIAELEETVRHLNHALREATEAPTFMGEPVSAEPAASIKGVDEYGPMLNWYTHWVNFPVGTRLYTSPPAQQEPVACQVCGGSGFIECDALQSREKNNGKWGRCLSCQPYTPSAAPTVQEPEAHLWKCLGRWSAYLVANGDQAV